MRVLIFLGCAWLTLGAMDDNQPSQSSAMQGFDARYNQHPDTPVTPSPTPHGSPRIQMEWQPNEIIENERMQQNNQGMPEQDFWELITILSVLFSYAFYATH